MFEFRTNGEGDCTIVECWIHTGLRVDKPVLLFSHTCSEAWVAALLVRCLTTELSEAIEKAHRRAYEQGWRDAKSKKKKKATGFSGYFTSGDDEPGWVA